MKEPDFKLLCAKRSKGTTGKMYPCDSYAEGCIGMNCKHCPMDWETTDELMQDVQEVEWEK